MSEKRDEGAGKDADRNPERQGPQGSDPPPKKQEAKEQQPSHEPPADANPGGSAVPSPRA